MASTKYKENLKRLLTLLFFSLYTGISTMPISSTSPEPDEEEEEEDTPAAATAPAPAPTTTSTGGLTITKSEPLAWPLVIQVNDDDKPLVPSSEKNVVTLLELGENICKKINDRLEQINQFRDDINEKYRNLAQDLDKVFEKIGAALAQNKKQ